MWRLPGARAGWPRIAGRLRAGRRGLATAGRPLAPPAMLRWDAESDARGGREDLKRELEGLFGREQVQTSHAVLLAHGTDESFHDPSSVFPDVVFAPRSTEEVSEAMKVAKRLGAPVIPFGAGTSLEGHVAALRGGLCVDFAQHMNAVLQVNEADMDCRVQAGCTRVYLNEQLKHSGLFFTVDPGADASIGGMVATGASGTNSVRYGTMKQNVMGLTCVLEDGAVVRTGSRARKSSAGFDLTSLLVGSEGTMGCITEVNLRLFGQPEAVASAVCAFDSTEGAINTVVTAMQYGIPLARAEYLDELSMAAVHRRFAELQDLLPLERPCLFLEFHGTERAIAEQISQMEHLADENGKAGKFHMATAEEERNRLWKARHQAYYAVLQLRPGSRGCPTDVCVPISRLAECIDATARDVKEAGLTAPIFGHVGDGNFHVILLAKPEGESQEYFSRIFAVNDRLVQRAIDMGGTCTGEHGIGYGKRKWLPVEHGQGAVDLMSRVQRAFDPDGRMNPGKGI